MDFRLNEAQETLRKKARDLLKDKCTTAIVRQMEEDEKGYPPELWQAMIGMGCLSIVFPGKYGGQDGNFVDLLVLLQEMGLASAPTPFLPAILGGLLILEGGNEQQKQVFLPKVSNGDLIVTLAFSEPSVDNDIASITTEAITAKEDFIINGRKLFVPYAHIANYMVCAAKTSDMDITNKEGISLFLVDSNTPGITFVPLVTGLRDKQFEVVFDKVHVPKEKVIGKINHGWHYLEKVLEIAAVAKCAEMVGAAQKILEMTKEYAKERVQFNRPIGSFQAIQHHCANMVIYLQIAELITYRAGWMLDKGLPCTKEVGEAKAWTNEACRIVSALGHQVHAGIAFIKDHDLYLYSRRARAWEYAFGDTSWHYEKIAQELLGM